MIVNKRLLTVLLFSALTPFSNWAVSGANDSLCGAGERVYFECSTKVKAGKKQIALCGSQSLTEKEAFLQYRFGKKGAVELQFPAAKANSLTVFKQSHYSRYQVNINAVGFSNKAATYWVLDEYVGDVKPPAKRQGLSFSQTSSKSEIKTLLCDDTAVSELGALTDVLPCAKDELYSIGDCE